MKKLLQLFGSGYASVFCLLFAVANRIIFTSLFSTIGRDTKVQLTFAQSLLAGKEMGAIKYFIPDLNTPVYDTYWFFLPGLTFDLIPLLEIFSYNEYKAVLAFDILVGIVFIMAIRFLGQKHFIYAGSPTGSYDNERLY